MRKLIFTLCAVLMFVLSGCSKYDDGPLTDRVDNLEKRVLTLEELCKQMNTNISSLQTLVNAMQDNDYITSVNPISEGGKTIGYKIDFAKAPSITIYHGLDGQDGDDGEKGQDGTTPVIGVKQDADGLYYWTLNGEWLLSPEGNKILAEGSPGQDGNDGNDGENAPTPQFKIDEGDWYLSLDNGTTWTKIGRATGADGHDGDSMFSSVDTSDPSGVTFTLSDGTKFTVPRTPGLSITFEEEGLIAMTPNTTREIGYTVSGNTSGLRLDVISSGNVRAKLSDNTSATGKLIITTGASVDEYDRVVVLATNGQQTIMNSLSFEEKDCLKVKGETTYDVSFVGATIELNIETNTEYTLTIPDEAKSWISIVGSRTARNETITLKIEPNEADAKGRSANLNLSDESSALSVDIVINQDGPADIEIPADMDEAFPDMIFQEYVLSNFDTDGDGVLTVEEALKVTKIEIDGNQLSAAAIRSLKARSRSAAGESSVLDGLQYFPNLTILTCNNLQLTSLDLSGNPALEELNCSNNLLTVLDVSGCPNLKNLNCSDNHLVSLDLSGNLGMAYLTCRSNLLTKLEVPSAVIEAVDCSSNQLETLDIPNKTKLFDLDCRSNKLTGSLEVTEDIPFSIRAIKCMDNQFSEIKVNCTHLYCSNNPLKKLDLSYSPNLQILVCESNLLTALDVSQNVYLSELYCRNNQITTLDLSQNERLHSLRCSNNQIVTLDLSQNERLFLLYCTMPSLKTLYLKTTSSIEGITEDRGGRNPENILDTTEIVFVD